MFGRLNGSLFHRVQTGPILSVSEGPFYTGMKPFWREGDYTIWRQAEDFV
jgi:hypothetical protein